MNIGFDAKRAFHNQTGLGYYSRTLIRSLSACYPAHQYYLFNPKPSSLYSLEAPNLHEVLPTRLVDRFFSSAWRSSWVISDLHRLGIGIYHGLSHEIPAGIHKSGIRSVVTIHDLIHERHPEQYSSIDVRIYSRKFRYACAHADIVTAISEQTKRDIIEFYRTPEEKIRVCYQGCNPMFTVQVSAEQKQQVRAHYRLPDRFFLYVGSVIERKNLLNICKAVFLLRKDLDIPLVVIGDGKKYKQQVKDYILQNGIGDRVIFLSEQEAARSSVSFQTATDFPAIYQSAIAMIYPSFYEGFGMPVLEALASRLPVITSNLSCLPEAGGEGAYYVNPASAEEIAAGMKKMVEDPQLVSSMIEKGWQHAGRFTAERYAEEIMGIYQEL